MKNGFLNRKMFAVACAALLFAGMGMMAFAQYSHRDRKQEQRLDWMQHEVRMAEYRQHLNQQRLLYAQSLAQLQVAKRMAHYRYQQRYETLMLQQQRVYEAVRVHDARNDPFYLTRFDRRYNRGGVFYMTNQYGIEHIHQAVQLGYAEGYKAGMADRQDRWRSDYESCDAYRDAIYGYNGYYVSRDDYNYYFREGFRRGYEDGFNRIYRYGSYENGKYVVRRNILEGIVAVEMLR
ncbi:MAG: hypothetical protein NTW95_09105 [Candidatus Aminicenantes bacterium]|nr:hypothetical protein [Candidatus Aminicenantes bacterium]